MVAIVVSAVLAFAAGLTLGLVKFLRVEGGETWDDWRNAPQIGGRWANLLSIPAGLATMVALGGFGVPAPIRAALLSFLAGFCLPFAVEGARRYARR